MNTPSSPPSGIKGPGPYIMSRHIRFETWLSFRQNLGGNIIFRTLIYFEVLRCTLNVLQCTLNVQKYDISPLDKIHTVLPKISSEWPSKHDEWVVLVQI